MTAAPKTSLCPQKARRPTQASLFVVVPDHRRASARARVGQGVTTKKTRGRDF